MLTTTQKTEEQLQADFLNDIFGEVPGYAYKRDKTEINLEKEQKTELDSQKPDGVLGFLNQQNKDIRVIIELKDSKTNVYITLKTTFRCIFWGIFLSNPSPISKF